ncbi:MAG: hypothetical protein ACREBS_05515 [Nitrososphaerales archaeon]
MADESPAYGTRGPDSVGVTTVRIELFVEDPKNMFARAVAAGATVLDSAIERDYNTIGVRPINRILQGAIRDPYGHIWLIGRVLN